jgi:hydrogenase expression/formation protein HypC
MCLGIPAQLVDRDTGHPDLAAVDMGGVTRVINMGLLDEPLGPGDWVLVHMGFALSAMTAEEARDALDALGAEREAEHQEAAGLEAARETVGHGTADREAVSRETVSRETAGGIR